MTTEPKPVYVFMSVYFHGWYDNGSTSIRAHVSVRGKPGYDAHGELEQDVNTIYERNEDSFAGPICEASLYAAANKAVTRYVEAMRLGDFEW